MKKIFVVSFLLLATVSAEAKNIWETQQKPAPGKSEVIGTYSNGCVIGTNEFPLNGYGWQVMHPERRRNYAHTEMVSYIVRLAKKVKDELNNVLIVGDMGLPKGGPFESGHNSHQTGIDVDMWYEAPPAALSRELSEIEREKLSATNMVDNKTKTVNENFRKYQAELLKDAASFPEVDRIFVNYAIKKEMCKLYKGQLWFAKIRPWGGHDDHFHVRLKCPSDSPQCKLPAGYDKITGDGCGETLDWWFRERTKEEIADMKRKEELRKKQKLPEACLRLIGRK